MLRHGIRSWVRIALSLRSLTSLIPFPLSPLFLAPLSEVFGRRPIYCISLFLYFIFTLPSALAKNAATLVVARMIAGLAASAPMCNVGGTIADVWEIENRGAPMAIFSGTILYVIFIVSIVESC